MKFQVRIKHYHLKMHLVNEKSTWAKMGIDYQEMKSDVN